MPASSTVYVVRNTPTELTTKEHGSADLHERGIVDLRFHACLCVRQSVDGIPPHSFGLALALTLVGIVLTFSPLLVWYMERQSWHSATVATAWVSYTWMGFLFLFLCIGLVFDLGHALATLLHFRWPAMRWRFAP
jgi:hypothetical protein